HDREPCKLVRFEGEWRKEGHGLQADEFETARDDKNDRSGTCAGKAREERGDEVVTFEGSSDEARLSAHLMEQFDLLVVRIEARARCKGYGCCHGDCDKQQ